jgi:hypothetical protein
VGDVININRARGAKAKPIKAGRPKKGGSMPAAAALEHLRKIAVNDVVEVASVSDLAALVRWTQAHMSSQLPKWKAAGKIKREDAAGKVRVRMLPLPVGKRSGPSKSTVTPKGRHTKKRASGHTTPVPAEHTETTAPEHTNSPALEHTIGHTKATLQSTPPDIPHPDFQPEISITYVNQKTPAEAVQIPPSEAIKPTAPEPLAAASVEPISEDAKMGIFSTRKAAAKGAEMQAETAEDSPPEAHQPPATVPPVTPPAPHFIPPQPAHPTIKGRIVYDDRGVEAVAHHGGGGPGFGWVAQSFGWWPALWGVILTLASMALSTVTAYLCVTGFMIVYPNDIAIPILFTLFEIIKFGGVIYLAACWRHKPWPWWAGATVFVVAVELINFAGVYDKLIADHVGATGARDAAYVTDDAGKGVSLEVAQGRLADADRRLADIDAQIARDTKLGRKRDAESDRRKRVPIASERDQLQQQVSEARAGRTTLGAQHKADEASSMPIRYAAVLLQHFSIMPTGMDPEVVTMFLSLLIVFCCDPLSIVFAGMVSAWKLFGRGGGK